MGQVARKTHKGPCEWSEKRARLWYRCLLVNRLEAVHHLVSRKERESGVTAGRRGKKRGGGIILLTLSAEQRSHGHANFLLCGVNPPGFACSDATAACQLPTVCVSLAFVDFPIASSTRAFFTLLGFCTRRTSLQRIYVERLSQPQSRCHHARSVNNLCCFTPPADHR